MFTKVDYLKGFSVLILALMHFSITMVFNNNMLFPLKKELWIAQFLNTRHHPRIIHIVQNTLPSASSRKGGGLHWGFTARIT
jgi:hypothetical protein